MTDNEIIKALEWLIFNFPKVEKPKNDADKMCNCINLYCSNALDFINRQKAENTDLLFKLNGVMHYVDKWLEGDELEQDEVVRAETMRKKTLRIIENSQKKLDLAEACIDEVDDALYRGEKNYYAECAIEKYKEMTEEIQND